MRVASSGLRSLIAWVIVLAGCAEPTEPTEPTLRSLAGTFVLQSVDGMPVPVLQLDYTNTRQYLLTDTLWADGRGHYTRATITAIDSVGRAYRAIQRTMGTGAYVIRGDTVDFPFTCPPGAMCIAPPVGWRLADGALVIAQRRTTGFMFVSRFQRIE
jgi:hypothetical protein